MLEPDDRQLLIEALRPPPGFDFDFAISTTYSLDLISLLTAPLAFTVFEWEGPGGGSDPDPIALLDAIRRHAERLVIFCEAGRIAVPRRHQPLFGYLEDRVVEVSAPRPGRAFHPKIWLLRYLGPQAAVAYRLIVTSRNLTFDASWDVILILDGELTDRKYAYSRNHPLGDFIAALPGLAHRPLDAETLERIEAAASEIRKVRFELPEGVKDLHFWPLGIRPRNAWPFGGRIDRLLIMSPFLSDSLLDRLTDAGGTGHLLISRPESLAALAPDTLERFAGVKVLSESAEPETEEELIEEDMEGVADVPDDAEEVGLSGLHAKVFIADAGWDARVWVGSANATAAAFSGNVEFVVELRGKKSRYGIDALLQGAGRSSFGSLLEDFQPPAAPQAADPRLKALKAEIEEFRRSLAAAGLILKLEPLGDDQFDARLLSAASASIPRPDGMTVRCWPISLPESQRAVSLSSPLQPGEAHQVLAEFGTVTFDLITSFVAFYLRLDEGEHTVQQRFVINARIEGAPRDRRERLLRSVLRKKGDFLRYLLLLLTDGGVQAADIISGAGRWLTGAEGPGGSGEIPLLETLVRTLYRDPQKLDQVAQLVQDLRSAPGGDGVIPEGFDEIWEPIWQARKEASR